jgi:hypothetical protein
LKKVLKVYKYANFSLDVYGDVGLKPDEVT